MTSEVIVNGTKRRASKFEHRGCTGGSEVEMSVVECVLSASVREFTVLVLNQHVRFSDWEGTLGVHGTNDLNAGHIEFMTPFGTVVGTHGSGEDHARFDDGSLEHIEQFLSKIRLLADALDGARRVSQDDKPQVVVSPGALDPSHKFDRLTGVLAVLHVTYPCGLDHALTAQTHWTGLCICLP